MTNLDNISDEKFKQFEDKITKTIHKDLKIKTIDIQSFKNIDYASAEF